MTRFPNKFVDPSGDRDDYEWWINHSDEDTFGKQRTIEHGGNTGGTGLVRQQGDESPLVLSFKGFILHKAQLEEMLAWYALCDEQTIYFEDFAGDEYEVIITAFNPIRHRTMRNPRDYANAPLWYWTYDITMEVIKIREGSWEGVTP